MDKFSLSELSGRTIFNSKLISNGSSGITFTENKYDNVDVFWEKYNKKYVKNFNRKNYINLHKKSPQKFEVTVCRKSHLSRITEDGF